MQAAPERPSLSVSFYLCNKKKFQNNFCSTCCKVALIPCAPLDSIFENTLMHNVYFRRYLSEVPLGGWTAFPRLGVAVQPRKGSAVYWHNLKRSGRSDMHMLHGGCPVILGSKWVANKWIREFANAFHNKCVDHINN